MDREMDRENEKDKREIGRETGREKGSLIHCCLPVTPIQPCQAPYSQPSVREAPEGASSHTWRQPSSQRGMFVNAAQPWAQQQNTATPTEESDYSGPHQPLHTLLGSRLQCTGTSILAYRYSIFITIILSLQL